MFLPKILENFRKKTKGGTKAKKIFFRKTSPPQIWTKITTLIVANVKTPKDWYKSDHALVNRIILLTLEEQLELDFDLIDVIPTGSYARKNIGYLCAIKCGAKLIYETDDDNKLVDDYRLTSIGMQIYF